ncbi:MAG: galactokinase [Desulfobacteraceae bacterium]|jgi:D-glycero-alpha-D-manno-heptose-7-phosphate kinase|nr:MAG: galactokinase [Desulfobacteraceae bacterium]
MKPSKSKTWTSARTILEKEPVSASAPGRIDSGGTFDIRALAIPQERFLPATVNIAISLRTSVTISAFEDGWVKISSEGFENEEMARFDTLPFDSPFGAMFAAVSYFGFHGLEIRITTQVPVQASLGGSSTALAALIKALSRLSTARGERGFSSKHILHLAYHLEDGINGGYCGAQDQAAAVFGGANMWIWSFGDAGRAFERVRLLDPHGQKELSRRIIIAYSGLRHVSGQINRGWVKDFLGGKDRAAWMEINKTVHRFAQAIKGQRWHKAGELLRREMSIRRSITPDALIPLTARLIDEAEEVGCGARFAGAGAGGCVWAIGSEKAIDELRPRWSANLALHKGARILECTVDPNGVR